LTSTAAAQFGTPRDLAFWGKRDISICTNLPSGIAFHWRAATLSATPLTNWTDSVQGYNLHTFAAGGSPFWPTWSAPNSVNFNGVDNFLYMTNITLDMPNTAVLVVYKNNDLSVSNAVVIGQDWGLGGIQLLAMQTTNYLFDFTDGVFAVGPLHTNLSDFLTVKLSTDSLFYAYTNGVASQYSGKATAWNNNGQSGFPGFVGGLGGDNNWNGTIKEIIFWTNVVSWTPQQVSCVHSYATNIYGITP
jgi:hypothetical protein